MNDEPLKPPLLCSICTALLPNHTIYCSKFELVIATMADIELEDPKLVLEVIDKITVQARCNKCKSSDIAIIIKRTSIAPDGPEDLKVKRNEKQLIKFGKELDNCRKCQGSNLKGLESFFFYHLRDHLPSNKDVALKNLG